MFFHICKNPAIITLQFQKVVHSLREEQTCQRINQLKKSDLLLGVTENSREEKRPCFSSFKIPNSSPVNCQKCLHPLFGFGISKKDRILEGMSCLFYRKGKGLFKVLSRNWTGLWDSGWVPGPLAWWKPSGAE